MKTEIIKNSDINLYLFIQKFLQTPLEVSQNIARLLIPADKTVKLTKNENKILKERYNQLLKLDLNNVENNLYPKELLFQIPFGNYLKNLPFLSVEVFKMYNSFRKNLYSKLPKNIDLTKYPDYFTRNFHWQSDGYFSYKSAEIYDLGVELLFLGTADVMRRQIIPEISKFLENKNSKSEMKLLDIACGTSRVIKQIHTTHPELNITGVDISPYYIEYSKNNIKADNINFEVANAENLPFEDNSFEVISCVYLFHELPRNVRKKVLSEMYRVLKTGGLLVIEDSIQLTESQEIQNVIYRFAKEFHEPYYKDYVQNPIEEMVEEAGFKINSSNYHYVAKVVSANKI